MCVFVQDNLPIKSMVFSLDVIVLSYLFPAVFSLTEMMERCCLKNCIVVKFLRIVNLDRVDVF